MADFKPTHGPSIDQERSHAFDGITEYDNSLPRWWLWMGYITVAVAIWYVFHFHFWTGVLSKEDVDQWTYQKAVQKAAEAELNKNKELSEEELRKLSNDPERIAAGKALVPKSMCMTCHGPTMTGLIGPNLTDKYWLYDSDMKEIVKTLKEGRSNNLMPGQAVTKLTDDEIISMACYVASLSRAGEQPGMRPQAAREKEDPITY
jgi:cytochrome c oxidase cbb3-type subunit III